MWWSRWAIWCKQRWGISMQKVMTKRCWGRLAVWCGRKTQRTRTWLSRWVIHVLLCNMYAALCKIQCSWARQEGDGGGGQHYVGGGDGGRHNGEAGEQCNAWGVGSRGSWMQLKDFHAGDWLTVVPSPGLFPDCCGEPWCLALKHNSCDKKAWQGHGLAHWRGGGYHHNLAFSEAVRVFDVRQRLDRFPAWLLVEVGRGTCLGNAALFNNRTPPDQSVPRDEIVWWLITLFCTCD